MAHSIGKAIAELRRAKGWTQIELAEKLNVSDKAVSKWEKDNGSPSIEFFSVLAEIFGVSIDYLITGNKKEEISSNKIVDENAKKQGVDVMLICKKCGTECHDSAKFCHMCGERIDDKKCCDACGSWIEQGAIFCSSCGARVDGKTICASCETLFEGSFCPECGAPAKAVKAPVQKAKASTKKPRGNAAEKVKSISELVSGACIALGALFALIFVFFICVDPSVLGASLGGLGLPGGDEKLNLYYFFGDVYEGVNANIAGEAASLEEWFALTNDVSMKEYAIIGTVVSALILLAVAGTAITALTLYVLNLLKKTQKSPYGWGMAAIISFIVGVLAFENLNGMTMRILTASDVVSMKWTGATTAGFVLCAVFGGLAIVAKMLAQGSAPWKGARLLKTMVSLAGFALVCVWLSAVSGLGMRVQYNPGIATESIELNLGFILFGGFFTAMFPIESITSATEEIKSKTYTVATMSFICQILSIVLIVVLAVLLLVQIKGLHKEKAQSKKLLVFVIAAWAISLAICILGGVSVSAIEDCAQIVDRTWASSSIFLDLETTKYRAYSAVFTMVMASVCLLFVIVPKVVLAAQKARAQSITE